MKIIKRAFLIMFSILLVVFSSFVQVNATDDQTSITINYDHGICEFKFYRVADFSEGKGFTLTDSFKSYAGNTSCLNEMDSSSSNQLRTLATTLAALVQRDKIDHNYSASTDGNGSLSWDNPAKGVYLVVGQQTRDEQYIYTVQPVLVFVPSLSDSNSDWNYDVVLDMNKVQKEPVGNKYKDYRIMKIWKDSDDNSNRPVEITVALLCDGIVYEKVVLNQNNNWYHMWTNLPADHVWSAVELVVPPYYKMSVENESDGTVITNYYRESGTTEPTEPTTPTTTNPQPTTNPEHTTSPDYSVPTTGYEPSDTTNIETPDNPPEERLPQTGQLWWPVPLLALLGIILILFGEAQKRNRSKFPGGYDL